MINAKRLILSITFPLAKLLNLYFVFMQMSSNKLIPSCSKLRRLVVFAYGLERFFVDEVLDDRGRGGRVINDEIPQEAKNQIDVFYQMLSSNLFEYLLLAHSSFGGELVLLHAKHSVHTSIYSDDL